MPVMPENPVAQTFDGLQKPEAHIVFPLQAAPLAASCWQDVAQYAAAPHDRYSVQLAPRANVALHCLFVVSQYAPVAHS
jgi:hypothetical protein